MVETFLLALILAKVRGYKLKPLFKKWEIYPLLMLQIAYVIMEVTIFSGNYFLLKYAAVFEPATMIGILLLVIRYRLYISGIVGSFFVFAGTACNKVAIAVNGGKMPVFPSLSYITGYVKPDAFIKVEDIHALGNSATRLKFMTDVIDVGYSIMSIGDILIRFFLFLVVFNTVKQISKQELS